MEKIKLQVSGNQIEVTERPSVITAGTVGMTAEFAFDRQWDSLSKIALFKAGDKVIATTLEENAHTVPWEVLKSSNQWLCIGVYGANREGTVVIPTLWAKISVIHTGTNPEGDPAVDPTTPIWQEALVKAEMGADAQQQLQTAVEGLAQELCPTLDSPTLSNVMTELIALDRYNEYMLNDHTDNRENPHNVTCEQLGALTMEHLIDVNVQIQGVSEMAHNNAVDMAIHANTEESPNPHEITCDKIGAATKEELQASIGDMESVLDGILAIQNQLIGGEDV